MKKIPKSLEKKIISCSNHYKIAQELDNEIRLYLWNNKLNLNDMLIDCCQVEHNPTSFIGFLNGEPDEHGDSVEDCIFEAEIEFDDFI